MRRPTPRSTLFPYTTLFRSTDFCRYYAGEGRKLFGAGQALLGPTGESNLLRLRGRGVFVAISRSEEHTSELQSLRHLVCRLLLEKKKRKTKTLNTQHNQREW